MNTKFKFFSGYGLFQLFNYFLCISAAILCVIPLIHVFAISLSSATAAQAGDVKLLPEGFTVDAYKYVLANKEFWLAMWVSVKRVILGTGLTLIMTMMTSYPLSKDASIFPQRKYYVWFFFFTMLFGGGMIPGYLVVKYTGMIDTIWSLIVPGMVAVGNIILMLNFFRQLPQELDDAAFMDGAGHMTILWRIYVPISTPSIATIALFTMVGHWNSWFDAMIFMNRPEHWPLQTYLQSIVVADINKIMSMGNWQAYQHINQKTLMAAQIFIGAFPILVVYPFLQKYFTKGIILGSVKG